MLDVLKRRFLSFRREAVMLWYAFRDPRTPFALKVASLLAGLYLVSPFDLIPFAVPFLGVVDDLVVVPLVVSLVAGRLPPAVREAAGDRADRWIARWFRRPLLAALVILGVLVAIWAGLLYLAYRYVIG